ncbi:hypothetical protein LINGRAHAP2_LOCUS19620 [Linum grandiflorum]
MHTLPHGERIVIPFVDSRPYGVKEVGLLGQFLGSIGRDHTMLSIAYDRWSSMDQASKDAAWRAIIVSIRL